MNLPILLTKQEMLVPHELMPVELRLKYSHYLTFRNYDYCTSAFFAVPPDRSHYVLADMLEYVMSVTLE